MLQFNEMGAAAAACSLVCMLACNSRKWYPHLSQKYMLQCNGVCAVVADANLAADWGAMRHGKGSHRATQAIAETCPESTPTHTHMCLNLKAAAETKEKLLVIWLKQSFHLVSSNK